jgi:hypothetical protein
MSTNCDVVGVCRTLVSPRATRSRTKCRSNSMCLGLMLNGVGRHVDRADVTVEREAYEAQVIAGTTRKPQRRRWPQHNIPLRSWSGTMLPLGGPRDEIVAKKHCITRGRTRVLGQPAQSTLSKTTTSSCGDGRRTSPKSRVPQIENRLESNKVGCPGIMHMKSYLLHNIEGVKYGCWGEGEDVTLRSRPSPWSSVQRRQDNGRRHPSLHTTSGEDLQRGHPTVRPRPAWRPTGDPAHCRRPCVATACYGPNL